MPEDPARYRSDAEVKGYVSMFRTKSWKEFAEKHKIKLVHFDQGKMGHERTKPTTIGYAGMDLGPLDGMRMNSPMSPSEWRDARDLSRRIALTKEWAEGSFGGRRRCR